MSVAAQKYQARKLKDKQLINAFKKIIEETNHQDDAVCHVTVLSGLTADIIKYQQLDDDALLKSIVSENSEIISNATVQLFTGPHQIYFTFTRGDYSDIVHLHISTNYTNKDIVPIVKSVQKNIKPYAEYKTLENILGKEVSETFRTKEEHLQNIEELIQKLTTENVEYRKQLDKEKSDFEKEVKTKSETEKQKLLEEIEARENEIKEKEKEIDLSSAKAARRKLRLDIKDKLADEFKSFSLSKDTIKKRRPIHWLFCGMILILTGYSIINGFQVFSETAGEYITYKLAISVVALIGAIVFYIRWIDSWFRQHADEEFKLKKLELDIDRASWVYEMAMDWKKDTEITMSKELVDRLTQGLFVTDSASERVRHPSEDLLATLFGGISELKVPTPGGGEVRITGRNLKKMQKGVTTEPPKQ